MITLYREDTRFGPSVMDNNVLNGNDREFGSTSVQGNPDRNSETMYRGWDAAAGEDCAECDQLRDQVKRLRAEFVNYRRRVDRDWQKARDRASGDVVTNLLPTLDHLEQALRIQDSSPSQNEGLSAYRHGIDLIYQELRKTLAGEGLERLELVDQPYDPELAEAVGMVDDDEREPGVVCIEMQAGWLFRGELLRPAKVLVNRREAPQRAIESPSEHFSETKSSDFPSYT